MTAPAFFAAGVVIVGCLTGFGVLVGKTFAALDREPDAPEPTIEMELAANWRVIRAYDTVYDDLVKWENEALDADFTSTALDIMQCRALLTERRDKVAAL